MSRTIKKFKPKSKTNKTGENKHSSIYTSKNSISLKREKLKNENTNNTNQIN